MIVTYKCRCMAEEDTIFVRDRRDDEDVVHWVEHVVGQALAEDHRRRSPACRSSKTEYIKIPVDQGENATVGRVTRQ